MIVFISYFVCGVLSVPVVSTDDTMTIPASRASGVGAGSWPTDTVMLLAPGDGDGGLMASASLPAASAYAFCLSSLAFLACAASNVGTQATYCPGDTDASITPNATAGFIFEIAASVYPNAFSLALLALVTWASTQYGTMRRFNGKGRTPAP